MPVTLYYLKQPTTAGIEATRVQIENTCAERNRAMNPIAKRPSLNK